MDDLLNEMYLKALKGFKNENEIIFNSFIAYRNMIKKILELQPQQFSLLDNDAYLSLSSINAIIKNELYELNKLNENFLKNEKFK